MSNKLDVDTIRAHYERITPVVEQLADVDEYLTIGLNDYSGWYVKRDHDDYDIIDEGFEREGRCATLANDYDTVCGRIDRALYALTSYKSRESLSDWEPCTISDGETEWRAGSPTPGYGDLRGVMAWGDIDLVDDLKPQRGELDKETRETIEKTLSAYVDEYARLYGSRDAIFALDSVGGAYVMGAPSATLPIATLFDDHDARERVMEAFVDRSNEWLKDAQDRIEDDISGAGEVIDPDWVNNCNRQYKAPLSLHTSHDAVVVPLDTNSLSYDLTPFGDVTDELIDQTATWAANLTDTDFTQCADTLVKRLWPDAYEASDSWQSALQTWVDEQREQEKQEERARKRARERRRKRKEEMGGGLEGAQITPFREDVYTALDKVDTAEVIKKEASTEYDTGRDSNDKVEFDPCWRTSKSGSSCFVDTSSNSFGDSGMGGGGHAAEAMALGDPSINYSDPSDDLAGEEWSQAVESLRKAGYDIPVYTPDANSVDADGDEYDQMPYWALRKAAVALGVLPEDAFIRAQNERGGYLKFPGAETYNHALAAVEDIGLEHNREYMSPDGSRPDAVGSEPEDDVVDKNEETTVEDIPEPEREQATASEPDNEFSAHSELDVEAGGYGFWETNREGGTYFDRLTNFKLDVDSYLLKDSERFIDLTVVPATGEPPYDVTVESDVFNDVREFKDKLVTGFTTTFDGGPADLNELRKLVGGQDAPVRTGTHHMGMHPDSGEFVTPNGVLDSAGWQDSPEKAYMEREIGAERAFGLTPEDHDDYDPSTVTEILELLPDTRFSERLIPALGWLYSAPLRPYIQDWEGQFNTLHVTGETGAGKSSTLSILWQLLGMNGEPMACDDTKFALITAMSSTNSIPMWFDEYKPGDMKDWEVDRFQNLMRKTTRGGVETRGNADKSTEEYHLKAPLMISGEQSIQGPAETRRSIQTRFRDGVKEPGSETKAAFSKLTGKAYTEDGETVTPEGFDLTQHAVAYYRFILRQPPEMLKELWSDARDHVRKLLGDNGITGVDDLPQQGIQTIFFGMTLYKAFASEMAGEAGMSADRLDLPSKEEVNDAMLYIAKQFGDQGARKSHLDRFVELASRAANEEYLEPGSHFKLIKEGEPDEELALKLSSVHDRVSKYARDHALDSEDLLNNATDYRERMAEAAEESDSYVITHTQNTPPLSRCARIDTDLASEQLEFSRVAFGAEPRSDDDEETADDGNEPDGDSDAVYGAEPIASVAQTLTGYVTVTADVLAVQDIGETGVKLVLQDKASTIDMVAWDEETADILRAHEGKTIVVKNAEVSEYDGTRQLSVADGVTAVDTIQQGVGHTTTDDEAGANTLSSSQTAATDGGADSEADQDEEDDVSNQDEDEDSGFDRADSQLVNVPTDAVGPNAHAKRIKQYVDEKSPTPEPVLKATLSTDIGLLTPDEFETGLGYGLENGLLQQEDNKIAPAE